MSSQARLFVVFVVAGTILAVFALTQFPRSADTVFVNGRIQTMDQARSVAQAIAVLGDRIVGVGAQETILRRFRAKDTVDLGGRVVFPAFTDAHAHLLSLGIARLSVDVYGAPSERSAAATVGRRTATATPGVWIRGRGWDQNLWNPHKFPTRRSLDAVAPNNPVILSRVDGHAVWVNTRVLEISGVDRTTPDPEGGKIVRDADGTPTGVFVDNAVELVRQHLPPLSEAETAEALHVAIRECLSDGITTVHDMGVTLDEIAVYKRLIDAKSFDLRVYAAIAGGGETWNRYLTSGPEVGYGNNRLTVRALKLYVDGALGSRGAALVEPYSDDSGNRGLTVTSEHELKTAVDQALTHGFQVCTHAIGDRGNNIILNVYDAALKAHPSGDARLRVEHAQVLLPEDVGRFRQLGVIPSMQPTHCTSDMYWAEARLGPRRVRGSYAWRSLLNTGVYIPGGSDFPVENPNPLLGIYAACTRRDREGKPASAGDVATTFQLSSEGIVDSTAFEGGWYAGQSMTRDEALSSFTAWASRAAFEEEIKGSIETGKLADFIVLSGDILNEPPRELLSTEVEATYLGGALVFRRSATSGSSQP